MYVGAGILRLENARHPCVENQEEISFIANDLSFEKGSQTNHIKLYTVVFMIKF